MTAVCQCAGPQFLSHVIIGAGSPWQPFDLIKVKSSSVHCAKRWFKLFLNIFAFLTGLWLHLSGHWVLRSAHVYKNCTCLCMTRYVVYTCVFTTRQDLQTVFGKLIHHQVCGSTCFIYAVIGYFIIAIQQRRRHLLAPSRPINDLQFADFNWYGHCS